MDFATSLGLVLGIAALLFGQQLEGGRLTSMLQPTAALIVFGGTLAATLLGNAPADLARGVRMLSRAFSNPASRSPDVIGRLVHLAAVAQKEGLVALDGHSKLQHDPFLRAAIQHVVDGGNALAVREILETDLQVRVERDLAAVRIYEMAGGIAPTMGILGAVLGLIHALENLQDPSALGGGIAAAFVATLYGVGSANLVLLPMASKLRRRIEEQRLTEEMVVVGALAIQEGQSPRAVEDRLSAFLIEAPRQAKARP